MTLKIVAPSEPIKTENLVITLFGQPGIGKSTLAYSAPRPLLFDFDGGAQRAKGRKDTVLVRAWSDVADVQKEDVANHDTLILDTVGRALEFLAADLIRNDPKLARKSGDLSMQGFGALKSAFAQWLSRVRSFGKHVILIAHEKEEKDGDNTIVRVDAMGATRVEVIRLSDLVGFVAADRGKRTLDFSPTDKHTGKNCAGFEILSIPDIATAPDYLATVMTTALQKMNEQTEDQRKREELIKYWMEYIPQIQTADAVNAAIADIVDDKLTKATLARRAKALGLVWNGNAFVHSESANAAA